MAKMRLTLKVPLTEEFKNPKEGRSLGTTPDDDAYHRYPVNYPKPADDEVDRSIWGSSENAKTFHQSDGLDEKK